METPCTAQKSVFCFASHFMSRYLHALTNVSQCNTWEYFGEACGDRSRSVVIVQRAKYVAGSARSKRGRANALRRYSMQHQN